MKKLIWIIILIGLAGIMIKGLANVIKDITVLGTITHLAHKVVGKFPGALCWGWCVSTCRKK